MTTGSKGLHVVTPIQRRSHFKDARAFACDLARVLVDDDPDRLTLEQRKKNRGGRILVDVQRNGYAQTAVPPYALRARPGAPVATPLEWRELSDSRLAPQRWNAGNVFRRLGGKGDPWSSIWAHSGSLPSARRKLEAMR
jgi:bifunctional non-homologous end joining protein LigD